MRIALALIAVFLIAPAAMASETLEKIRKTQTITLAYRESPPFSFTADNKQIVGYSVDVCLKMVEAVKRELKLPNLKVDYIPVDSTTRFDTIIHGRADLECGSTTNNAERRMRVAFALPHFFSSVRMLAKANSGIQNWPDLRNRTVVITRDTTTIALINERNNIRTLNIKVVEGKDDFASFSMVEQGKADAFPMDDVLLYSLRSVSKVPSDFVIVGEPLSVEPYSIMLRKGDSAFKKLVDAELVRMTDTGEIYKMYNHWFMHANGPRGTNMNMPMGYLLRDALKYPTDKF